MNGFDNTPDVTCGMRGLHSRRVYTWAHDYLMRSQLTTGGPTDPIYKLAKGLLMPVASGGIHIWHMPALVDIFGDDACLQFGVGTTSKG